MVSMKIIGAFYNRFSFAYSLSKVGGMELFFHALHVQFNSLLKREQPIFNVYLSYKDKRTLVYLKGIEDLYVIKDIFVDKVYCSEKNAQKILDIGGHIGLSALWFTLEYPEAQIRVYEPDSEIFKRLKENTKSFPLITAVNSAVSDTEGTMDFYVSPYSIASSLFPVDGATKTQVKVENINSVIQDFGIPDIMKVDAEGAEYRILAACKERTKIPLIIAEFDSRGGNTAKQFQELLDLPDEPKNKDVVFSTFATS